MLPQNLELAIDPSFELADGTRSVRTTYSLDSQQELQGYSVTVIADSIVPLAPLDFLYGDRIAQRLEVLSPQRITTIVARFPRCILAEFNTHRTKSRNSASSRARSIKVVIADVMEDPYVPIFTKNQKGMGGPIVSPDVQAAARVQWLRSRDSAVAGVLSMLLGQDISVDDLADGNWKVLTDDYYQRVYLDQEEIPGALNLHKQNVNRLLEPFMWHEAVVTATEWTNFLQLRDHDEADPAIHGIARLVDLALKTSKPVERAVHAPFAGELLKELGEFAHLSNDLATLRRAIEAANYSAGAAAQVSYRPVGDGGAGANPAKLADRLLAMAHLSPFEHAAFSARWLRSLGLQGELPSNLSKEWIQHRTLLWYLQDLTGKDGLPAVLDTLS